MRNYGKSWTMAWMAADRGKRERTVIYAKNVEAMRRLVLAHTRGAWPIRLKILDPDEPSGDQHG